MRYISDFYAKLCIVILFLIMPSYITAEANSRDNIVVLKNTESILPIGDLTNREISVISIGQPQKNVFSEYCRFYSKKSDYKILSTTTVSDVIAKIPQSSLRLIAVYSCQPWAVQAYSNVAISGNAITVYFIPDKDVVKFEQKNTSAIVLAHDASYRAQVESAETIFGGINVAGKLSMTIPGVAEKGAGIKISKTRLGFSTPTEEGFSSNFKSKLDSVIKFNIAKKSFPGCQIVVVRNGNIVVNEAYGRLTYDAKSKAVNKETLYDIASMTKATATIAGLMSAYDEGLYELDAPVSEYLPRLQGTNKSEIRVKELLFHESGMPSTLNTYALMVDSTTFTGKLMSYKRRDPYTVKLDRNVYGNRMARRRTDIMHSKASCGFEIEIARGVFGGEKMKKVIADAIYNIELKDKNYRYSCLNFCILKDMEEALTGESHEQYIWDYVFSPIGAWHTMFNPAIKGYTVNVAPTEKDDFMRRQLLKGYVHDEIAAYSGGVQGNAGLFSTAEDISKLCQTWLNDGFYGGVSVFSKSTVKLFTTEKSEMADRGLGFDRASRVKGLQGLNLPDSMYGHTGFTGTCFWVDPENEIIVVFLCNRIYPSRDNASFRKYSPRTEIMRVIYGSIKE